MTDFLQLVTLGRLVEAIPIPPLQFVTRSKVPHEHFPLQFVTRGKVPHDIFPLQFVTRGLCSITNYY